MRYNLATVVWGEEYTDLFVNIVIPNLLTPGNFDALCKTPSPVFRIFTTFNDAIRIKGSPAFEKLSEMIAVKFYSISEADLNQKYTLTSKYLRKAIEAAIDDNAVIILIGPDILRAQGYMANILRIAESGKRAVMISEIRVTKDTFLPEFIKQFSSNGAPQGITPRQLAKLASEHLHPVSKSFLWNSKKFHNAPSCIYFEVPKEGILARCFHLSPVLINPVCKDAGFSTTIDGDYILNACPNIGDIYIASDSDEFMSVEMSSFSYPGNAGIRPPSPLNIAAFAKYSADGHSRIFIRHKLRFHFDDISPRWAKVEEFSDKAIDKIFYWLQFEPLLFWPYGIVMQAKLFVRNIVKLFLGESLTRKLAGRIRSMRTRTFL